MESERKGRRVRVSERRKGRREGIGGKESEGKMERVSVIGRREKGRRAGKKRERKGGKEREGKMGRESESERKEGERKGRKVREREKESI